MPLACPVCGSGTDHRGKPWKEPQSVRRHLAKKHGRRAYFDHGYTVNEMGCWIWDGARTRAGYAQFGTGYVHVWAHEEFVGLVPTGHEVDHLCGEVSCVNPAHLEAVSPRVNNLRSNSLAARRARQTHCSRGHEFNDENTYWKPNGKGRDCRTCQKIRRRTNHAARSTAKRS